MGMTDAQFHSYQKRILRQLERIIKGMNDCDEKDELQLLIDDLKGELSKP